MRGGRGSLKERREEESWKKVSEEENQQLFLILRVLPAHSFSKEKKNQALSLSPRAPPTPLSKPQNGLFPLQHASRRPRACPAGENRDRSAVLKQHARGQRGDDDSSSFVVQRGSSFFFLFRKEQRRRLMKKKAHSHCSLCASFRTPLVAYSSATSVST